MFDLERFRTNPLALKDHFWPTVTFYDKQVEIIHSVRDDDETDVVAAHQVGKDYVAAFIALWAFLCHREARVVTTSVKADHLRVLFGEIGRFIDCASRPGERSVQGVLSHKRGGPLVLNHWDIRKASPTGEVDKISYLRGMVSERGEGMAGHHAAYTLLIVDEASGVEDVVFERAETWAKRRLIFGNPYGLNHWFHKAVKGGDIPALA